MKKIEQISFFLLMFPIFSFCFTTVPYWVDSEIGVNGNDCGLNSTIPCQNLTFALSRAFEDANTTNSTFWVELRIHGNFSNEVIDTQKGGLEGITITSDDESPPALVNCSVATIKATLSNIKIVNSIYSGGSTICRNIHTSTSNMKFFFDLTVISSYFWNTPVTRSLSSLTNISYSNFSQSPLACNFGGLVKSFVRGSRFENSLNKPALQACGDYEIRDSTFHNNQNPNGQGGAISSSSRIQILNSKFTNNYALQGGAIYATTGPMHLENSIITENSAKNEGGGLYLSTFNELICTNSEIDGNSAQTGGGIYLQAFDNNIVGSNCKVKSNYANIGGGLVVPQQRSTATGLEFFNNTAGVSGAGIYVYPGSTLTLSHSNFSFNELSNGKGGAIYFNNTFNIALYDVTFTNSQSGDVVLLQLPIDLVFYDVTFANPLSDSPFICPSCNTCPAAQTCLDCPGGCVKIGENSTCMSYGTCFNGGTCALVQNKQQKCDCRSGYIGDNCLHSAPPEKYVTISN